MARVGRAAVGVVAPRGMGMAGFGPLGRAGRPNPLAPLWMRALSLRDDAGHHVVLVACELWSGTTWLHDAVRTALATEGIVPDQLLVAGCHTHAGPGRYAGNTLYDLATTKRSCFACRWARQLASEVATAVKAAIADEQDDARLALVLTRWSDAGRNRSLGAALAASGGSVPAWWTNPGGPGHGAPPGADDKQKLVDRRLPVLVATDAAGRLLATVALAHVHATALGPAQRTYSADWPGAVSRTLGANLADLWAGAPFVGVGVGAAGDVGPLPSVEPAGGWRQAQGPALVTRVANEVAPPWEAAVRQALASGLPASFALASKASKWSPPDRSPPFCIGKGVLEGPIDPREPGDGVVVPHTGDHFPKDHPQHPKVPALGSFQRVLHHCIRPEPEHPVHVVRLVLPVDGLAAPDGVILVTLPGEITAHAGWRLEEAVREAELAAGRTVGVVVLGYTNDYFGYVTTPEEYAVQEYEGAHTIYGRDQLELLTSHVLGLL